MCALVLREESGQGLVVVAAGSGGHMPLRVTERACRAPLLPQREALRNGASRPCEAEEFLNFGLQIVDFL